MENYPEGDSGTAEREKVYPAGESKRHEVEKRAVNIDAVVLHDSTLVDISSLSKDFVIDMRYATVDNFLGEKVYDCAQCWVRYEVAKSLLRVSASLKRRGLRLTLYDCYRPLKVQRKMWAIMPRPGYVANPYTSGSIHNRGAAVDVSLTDREGNALKMGTDFDHFGKEARHSYQDLPPKMLQNRKLLKATMESFGFKAIRSEWWHYIYGEKYKYTIADHSLCTE